MADTLTPNIHGLVRHCDLLLKESRQALEHAAAATQRVADLLQAVPPKISDAFAVPTPPRE